MQAPKILMIANVFPPLIGGSAAVYENYCRRIKDRVMVVTPWRSCVTGEPIAGWKESDERQPFPVRRLPLLRPVLHASPATLISSIWRQVTEDIQLRMGIRSTIFQLLKEFQPEVVCLGELHSLAWLGAELRERGLPVVQFIHGEEVIAEPKSRQLRNEAKRALRDSEAIVAVSAFTRDRLLERGVHPHIIHLINNGVDTLRFTPGPKSDAVMSRHGIHGKRVLLTVGRLEPRKGHDHVIQAMPRILAAVPDAIYLIVGDGSTSSRLAKLSEQLGVEASVIFAGNVSDRELADYYRTCDLFIMANRTMPDGDTEGFGLVFLEAAACNKPVVGGKAGGVPDAVLDGETGLLVDGASVDEIGNAAVRILEDCQFGAGLAARGLLRSKEFDWSRKTEEFVQVCFSVVERERKMQVLAR